MWVLIKKWWKLTLIILTSVIIIFYYIFLKSDKERIDSVDISTKLNDGINEIKDRISEVQHKAVIESAIARTQIIEVKKDLHDISKETDTKKRRERLAALAKRTY